MTRFVGRRVLITGASRGLGRDVAVAFAREGAYVGVGYHAHPAEARTTLAAVEGAGGSGEAIGFDVRDPAAVDSALNGFARGGLDVLVNSAATLHDAWAATLAQAEWQQVVDVNLTGTFNCCRAAARVMLVRKAGVIVNVASVAGFRAAPGQASYAASKGGVLALTATLAAELAPRGIRVNAVVPGLLSTGMGRRLDRDVAERLRGHIPLGRFGAGDDVARAVLFLASEDAGYVVGHSLVVDGGLSA